MLLIHLVLLLLLISVNLTVCTLAYAHEHSIIHDPAARRRVSHCVPAPRAYARSIRARRIAQARDTAREILEHASAVLGSGLGKIGPGGSGIVTPWGDARGRVPAAGCGALISSWGAGRGAQGAGQRPPAPLPTLLTEDSRNSRRKDFFLWFYKNLHL